MLLTKRILFYVIDILYFQYKNELIKMWESQNFIGCVARQLLAPPCKYYYFDKSIPGNFAPRVCDELPARVCLRALASYQTLSYISLSGVLAYFYGYPMIPFYFFVFLLFVFFILVKAFVEWHSMGRRSNETNPQPESERFVPLDVSFVD